MTLEIYDLGASNRSAQFITEHKDPDLIAMDIHIAVHKMKALRSRSYECTWNPKTKTGFVFAGWRTVGKVRLLK